MDQYDFVISDNLIEILEIRKDAWIIASFFLAQNNQSNLIGLQKKIRNNVKKNNPKIIASEIFALKYLNQYDNVYKVGLFTKSKRKVNLNHSLKKNY